MLVGICDATNLTITLHMTEFILFGIQDNMCVTSERMLQCGWVNVSRPTSKTDYNSLLVAFMVEVSQSILN